MKMTYDQYIQNPMGIANAVISNREMYRNLYRDKFDKILLREAGKIDYKLYTVGVRHIAYIKIPSEVVKDFYYDVLIEFTPPKKLITSGSLKDYNVRFYSNDPSFVFTFVHAFYKNDMFFRDFEAKMSKRAIKERAKEKNPSNQIGYVKSLYFAYLFMSKRGLFSKIKYIDPYSESALKRDIVDADKKIEQRQDAQKSKSAKQRKERASLNRDIKNSSDGEMAIKPATSIGKIKQTRAITNRNSNNSSKFIKTVKKTKR